MRDVTDRPLRFLTIPHVAEELATSEAQISALVKCGNLEAIRLGGRGQWRIERAKLEEYIERKYAETAAWVRSNPMATGQEDLDEET